MEKAESPDFGFVLKILPPDGGEAELDVRMLDGSSRWCVVPSARTRRRCAGHEEKLMRVNRLRQPESAIFQPDARCHELERGVGAGEVKRLMGGGPRRSTGPCSPLRGRVSVRSGPRPLPTDLSGPPGASLRAAGRCGTAPSAGPPAVSGRGGAGRRRPFLHSAFRPGSRFSGRNHHGVPVRPRDSRNIPVAGCATVPPPDGIGRAPRSGIPPEAGARRCRPPRPSAARGAAAAARHR